MAKKQKGLPFERRGYLTVAEKAFVQAASLDDTSVGLLAKLTQKISEGTGKGRQEVLDAIAGGAEDAWLVPYQSEIVEVVSSMSIFQEKIMFVRATALLFSRIDGEWSIEQTLDLNEEIVAQLSELYMEEEARDTTAIEASQKASEGVEKKGKP